MKRYQVNKLMAMVFDDHILMMAMSSLCATFVSKLTKHQQDLCLRLEVLDLDLDLELARTPRKLEELELDQGIAQGLVQTMPPRLPLLRIHRQ